MTTLSTIEIVIRYHEETKDPFYRYACSLGYLDWATQPCPFRYYEGAQKFALERFPKTEDFPFDKLDCKPHKPPRPSPMSV